MKETLYSQLCDCLDQYKNREVHFSDCVGLCEEVALKFAGGFGEWMRDNVEIKPINNFMNGFYYNGKVTTTDELIKLYQDHLQQP